MYYYVYILKFKYLKFGTLIGILNKQFVVLTGFERTVTVEKGRQSKHLTSFQRRDFINNYRISLFHNIGLSEHFDEYPSEFFLVHNSILGLPNKAKRLTLRREPFPQTLYI